MPFVRAHKIGGGVNISGRGRSIDLVVRTIGSASFKDVLLEVRGVSDLKEFYLSEYTPEQDLGDGVGVVFGSRQPTGNWVRLVYKANLDYRITVNS